MASFDNLPKEILMKIYTFLESTFDKAHFEGVCKRWNDASRAVWSSLTSLVFFDLLYCESDVELPAIDYDLLLSDTLRKGCRNLRKLDVSGSSENLTSESLSRIGKICTELRYLDLSESFVDNTTMETISIGCPKIEIFIARYCQKLTENGVNSLCMNSKNLIYVDLQGNERMTGKCFSELNPGCRVVNVMAGWKIANKAIDILASRCTDLEVLNFGYCRRIQMRRLPDMSVDRWVGLNKLTEKCQNLKILHACGSLSVPPDDLLDLKNTQHLQVLCLQGLKQLDDVHLEGIGKSCPALQELNISGTMSMGYAVTGKGLTHLAHLPCLAILILGGLLKLTNDGLESLGKRGLLRTLLIRGNTRCDDEGFYHIAMNCSHLKFLDICYMSSITSATLKALIEARAMWDIEHKSPTLQIFAEGSGITREEVQTFELQGTGIEVFFDRNLGDTEAGIGNNNPGHHEITPALLNSNKLLSF